jgi:hypothetical protein
MVSFNFPDPPKSSIGKTSHFPEKTLEQQLIDFLFPKSGPQDKAAKAYGASEGDRIALGRFPEHVQQQLIRLCDAAPVIARDLIRLAIDVYDCGVDDGRTEEYDIDDTPFEV